MVTNYVACLRPTPLRSRGVACLGRWMPASRRSSSLDSIGDLMPAAQLDDMVAHLNATGVTNYQARTIPAIFTPLPSGQTSRQTRIAFLAAHFAEPHSHADRDANSDRHASNAHSHRASAPTPSASPTPMPSATDNTLLNISTGACRELVKMFSSAGSFSGQGDWIETGDR